MDGPEGGVQGSSCVVTVEAANGRHGARRLHEGIRFSVVGERGVNVQTVRCVGSDSDRS